ncbi:hypothetical protein ACTFIW_013244 [Dictyostelium discoideum]
MIKKTKIIYLLGILLYIGGIVSIYYYPKNAHNTYMSENALMPGTARVTFDYSDGSKVHQFSNGFQNHLARYNKLHQSLHGKKVKIDPYERSKSCSQWLIEQLKDIGIESYIHRYNIPLSSTTTTTTTTNNTFNNSNQIKRQGYNVYSVLRAPKSDGRESIVLSTSFNSSDESSSSTTTSSSSSTESSVGVALTIMQYLQKKGNIWLAKDLILVISDTFLEQSSSDNNIGLKSWLHDYHDSTMISKDINNNNNNKNDNNNYFPRAGAIQAAINIEVSNKKYQSDHVYVLAEGSNGQLPNLDLINTVGRLAKREGYSKSMLLSPSSVNKNDELLFIPAEHRTLARFMLNQAIGIPTGDHGLFNKYHIDAITLGVSGVSSTMGARVLIGTIRSLNNLLEKLHQSFYYYLLPSPFHYISIGEYMISIGLIISPLAFGVIYLLISLSNIFTSPTIFTPKSTKTTTTSTITTTTTETTTALKKKKNLFEELGTFECLDTPKDIVYSITIVALFQLIGISLFSLPQTFTNATSIILNYLSNFEIIGLFGIFGFSYFILFFIVLPILDKMFYPKNEPIKTFKESKSAADNNNDYSQIITNSNRNHLKSGSNSFFVFSNLPILIFITTMSLLNFSFCTFASILSIPLCFISQIINNINNNINNNNNNNLDNINNNLNNINTNNIIRKLWRLILTIKKLIVYSLLLLFSPPVILYLFSHYILNDQNVFIFLLTIIKQYDQYSTLLFPFLSLIYIPLNLSILKSIK